MRGINLRSLVDLGQHGISWLRNNCGGKTGNQTRSEIDGGLASIAQGLLGEDLEESLACLLKDDELGHGVRNLLEQDGSESRVEGTDSLVLGNLGHSRDKSTGKGWLGNETDTGGLKGTEGDIGKELCEGRGSEVDCGAVLDGILVSEKVDGLLLEKLISSELESTLEEVSSDCGSESGEKSSSSLRRDDLAESGDHALVVDGGLELDTSLDAIENELAMAQFQSHVTVGKIVVIVDNINGREKRQLTHRRASTLRG